MENNRTKRLQLHKDNHGFTLVEMIVVMVILAIILAAGTIGIISWQEWSYFNKQNDYAQDLFVAAQNQLTEYDANGYLSTIDARLARSEDGTYSTRLDLEAISDANGEKYKLDEVWYESGTGADASKYRGDLVYVSCKKGDYELYLEDKSLSQSDAARSAKATGADILFELLESYVYDTSILNAAISVEFAPGEGQVFSVCYSDRIEKFVYADVASGVEGVADIRMRAEDVRKEKMVGYYGVDTIATSTTASVATTAKITEVSLNNAETLNLSFKVTDDSGKNLVQKLTYTVEVRDLSDTLLMTVTVDGSSVKNYANRTPVNCKIEKQRKAGNGAEVTVTKNYDLLCWVDTGRSMHIVFDAVDLDANASQYAADIQNIRNNSESSYDFEKTYSFHRFGLDVENIKCYISGAKEQDANGEAISTMRVASNSSNVYFASTSVMSGKYVCAIKNARHLYNVRYLEDLAFDTVKSLNSVFNVAADNSHPTSITFAVMKNFDWSEFVNSGNVYASSGTVAGATVGTVSSSGSKSVANAVFPSITQLRYGDEFIGGLSDKIPVISGLEIKQLANQAMKVYGNTSLMISSDVSNGIYPAGLFAYNYGTVRNVALDRIQVTGTKKVGAVCGVNAGSIKYVSVQNSGYESVISGQEDVGGIIGYQVTVDDSALNNGVATSVELRSLTNRAKVEGMLRVGGIVGSVYMSQPTGASQENGALSISIIDCKNYGGIQGVYFNESGVRVETELEEKENKKVRFLGGITGLCDNQTQDTSKLVIKNCTSSPEFSNKEVEALLDSSVTDAEAETKAAGINKALKKKLRGIYVGGIVGYNYYGKIENCDTKSEDGKAGYVFGYQYVGGIVGFNQGPASGVRGGTDSTNLGVNEAYVVGYKYVGGISGCNADIDETAAHNIKEDVVTPDKTKKLDVCLENWTNKGIVYAAGQYAGGITGYNAGLVYNCHSEVEAPSTGSFFRSAYAGDYIGGIAGYNNGVIGNTPYLNLVRGASNGTIEAVCYISGTNYVGGIVGYNDVNAVIEDYALAGGYIHGNPEKSCYVGGYAGFNASLDLLMTTDSNGNYVSRSVESHPYEVTGLYFVGGCIGGNILDTNGYDATPGTEPEVSPTATATSTPTSTLTNTPENTTTATPENTSTSTPALTQPAVITASPEESKVNSEVKAFFKKEPSTDGANTVWFNIEIENKTSSEAVIAYVDLSMLSTYGDFNIELNGNNYYIDNSTKRIYFNLGYLEDSNMNWLGKLEPGKKKSIPFAIVATSSDSQKAKTTAANIYEYISNYPGYLDIYVYEPVKVTESNANVKSIAFQDAASTEDELPVPVKMPAESEYVKENNKKNYYPETMSAVVEPNSDNFVVDVYANGNISGDCTEIKIKVTNNTANVVKPKNAEGKYNWEIILQIPDNLADYVYIGGIWGSTSEQDKENHSKYHIYPVTYNNGDLNGNGQENTEITFNLYVYSKHKKYDDQNSEYYRGNKYISDFINSVYLDLRVGEDHYYHGSIPTSTPTNTPTSTPTASATPTPTQSITSGLTAAPTSVPEPIAKNVISAQFRNNNYIGQLTGEAFVGGYIGYNRLVKVAEGNNASEVIKALAEDLKTRVNNIESNNYEDESKKLAEIFKVAELASQDTLKGKVSASDKVLCINNSKINGKTVVVKNNIGGIKGGIIVGGVLGYNANDSKLEIYNIENSSMITAEYAIENADEQKLGENARTTDYNGKDITYTYSYAGGIIGRVGENTKLINCSNASTATVTTVGTYTGGLCEVNAGIITDCTVYSFGSSMIDYLGGICGLNKKGATIMNCSVGKEEVLENGETSKVGATLSGRSVVGGIAAENFGTISSVKVSSINMFVAGKTNGNDVHDGVVGGIVGFNGSTGIISLSKPATSVNIVSNGDNVGGLIGINEGSIKRQTFPKEAGQEMSDEKKLTYYRVTGKVTGRKNVGGIVGTNRNAEGISWLTNNSTVTAANGNAGGIVGNNEKGNISYCTNLGKISATESGNAGGITAVNKGGSTAETKTIIEHCVNKDKVTSKNGIGAGIVALNGTKEHPYAEINNCTVEPENENSTLTFASYEVVGGICGINYGNITNPTLRRVTVQNQTNSVVSDIGVVTGRNMATGVITLAASVDKRSKSSTVKKSIENCSVRTYKNNCNLGGIVGANYGQVSGAAPWDGLPTTIIDADIALFEEHAEISCMGGVAGRNAGTIENISVNGTVEGNLGSDESGYGGIAGVSDKQEKDPEGTPITNSVEVSVCTFDGTVRANGSGGAYARIGGIVGLNGAASTISECAIGVLSGGETNVFAGDVEKKDPSTKATGYKGLSYSTIASDTSSYSYIGGITGENYGKVLSCDNHRYESDDVRIESFAGVLGGIVGVNQIGGSVFGVQGKPVSTGSKWKVISRTTGNDIGSGGIIGNVYSGNDMSYLDNYAYVQCLFDSNTTTGGIIGRIDQNINIDLKFENCNNYGEVIGYNRSGGLIGVLKNKGIIMTDCKNYGTIASCKKGGVSAGIICETKNCTSNIIISGTINHGLIKAGDSKNTNKAFGFIEDLSVNSGTYVCFSNCVNTGISSYLGTDEMDIDIADKCGAHFTKNTPTGTAFINCRNYAPSGKMLYSFSVSGNNVRFENCLDFGGNTNTKFTGTSDTVTSNLFFNNFNVSDELVGTVNDISLDTYKNTSLIALKKENQNSANGPWVLKTDYSINGNNSIKITMTDNNPYTEYGKANYEKYNPLYDDPNSGKKPAKNSRLAVYLEMDKQFEALVGNTVDVDCDSFGTDLVLDGIGEANGNYVLKWNEVKGAAGYEIYYTLNKKIKNVINVVYSSEVNGYRKVASEDLVYIGNGKLCCYFDIKEVYDNWPSNLELSGDSITFYVRAINKDHLDNDDASCKNNFTSKSKDTIYTETLPMPIVHMELISGNKMVAVLDNAEEFKDYYGKCSISYDVGCEGIKTDSSSEKLVKSISFVVEPNENKQGEYYVYSAPFELVSDTYKDDVLNNTGSNQDKATTAKATRISGYNRYSVSPVSMAHGTLPSNSDMESIPAGTTANLITAIATKFIGFSNTSVNNLVYNVQLYALFKDFTVMSDIVSYDSDLGIEVARSYGTIKAANRVSGNGVYFVTELAKFAPDILEKDSFEVRTYHISSQAGIEQYGHEVASGVAASDVLTIEDDKYLQDDIYLKDDKYLHRSITVSRSIYDSSTGKLRPGYVVGQNEDGTYDIWYNSLLEMDETESDKNYHVQRIKYTLSKDSNGNAATTKDGYRYYTWVQTINGTTVTSSDSDQNVLKINAKPVLEDTYTVERVKQTDQNGNVTGEKNLYTFKWDQNVNTSSALYKNAEYYIELIGETEDKEKVFIESKNVGADRTYSVYDELDNWKYVKLCFTVVRLGEEDTNSVTTILPSMTEKVYENKLKISTLAMPSVVLASEDGTYNKNDLIYSVRWDAAVTKSEKDTLAGYLIKAEVTTPREGETTGTATHYLYVKKKDCEGLTEESDVVELVKKYDPEVKSNMCTMDESQMDGKPGVQVDSCSALLDLTYYKGGEGISISVMAVAMPKAEKYTDSEYSEAFKLTLPTRLAAPDLKKMTVADAYKGNTISSSLLNAGISVTLTSNMSDKGHYEFAIAIYDQAGKDSQDSDSVAKPGSTSEIKNKGDANGTETGCWNSGAVCTLYTKENPVVVSGDLKLSNYKLKTNSNSANLSDYAGMWVKVVVRSVYDNRISSPWTDSALEKQNYFWFQIPKLKLDKLKLTSGTEYRYKDEVGRFGINSTNTGDVIENRALSFSEIDYADGYVIRLNETYIYLDAVEDGYKVYVADTRDEALAAKSENQRGTLKLSNNENVVSAGAVMIDDFKNSFVIKELSGESEAASEVNTVISLSPERVITVILPDILRAGNGGNMIDCSYEKTLLAEFEAVVDSDRADRYVAPDRVSWSK